MVGSAGNGGRGAADGSPSGTLYYVLAVNAARQYSTHFRTSFTASDPSGTEYSSSIEAGMFHLFFLTSCRISLIGVSPVPQGRFRAQWSGVVRSLRWKLAMRPWCFSRNCIGVPPTLPAATQWPKSTFALLPCDSAKA